MTAGGLNAGQRSVVENTSPLIVVSAGAGSGKTKVLSERFADVVLSSEAAGVADPVESVLLITFTDKAAGELAERVRRVFAARGRPDLARSADDAWISTIHGFCARIVRRHALDLGIDPGFGVLADPETGCMRFEAFEAGVREAMTDATVAELLDAHGVATVRSAVLRAHDRLRSAGRDIDDIRLPEVRDPMSGLTRLATVLAKAIPDYRRLKRTATVERNLEAFEALRDRVSDLMKEGLDSSGGDVLSLGSLAGSRQGSAEMKELTATVNEALADVVQDAVDEAAREHARAWVRLLGAYDTAYRRLKSDVGVLDFEDLQSFTRRLWIERPRTAERYAERFSEVMVDEFQDTNRLQMQVIEPVARNGMCLVGDAQQSIYRFRDADVTLLAEKRMQASAGEGACRLTVNYRSHPELLETLNAWFGNERFFGEGYLHLEHELARPDPLPWPEELARVQALVIDKKECTRRHWREAEMEALAGRLRNIVDKRVASPDDIVVLVRASASMGPVARALRAVGFEVIASAAGGFWDTPEMGDVRSLLRVLTNTRDEEGALGLLAGGFGGVSDDALYVLTNDPRGLWQAVQAHDDPRLCDDDRARLVHVANVIGSLLAASGRVRLADVILKVAIDLGERGGGLSAPGAWASLQKIARIAAELERMAPSDPAALLRHLDERETHVSREPVAGLAIEGSGAIRVMTVHAAKGLEFPVVALADLGRKPPGSRPVFLVTPAEDGYVATCRLPDPAEGKRPHPMPWSLACEGERALDDEEARRVFYVACTRAEEALVLTGSTDLAVPDPSTPIAWTLAADAGLAGMSVEIVRPSDGDVPRVAAGPLGTTPQDEPRSARAFAPVRHDPIRPPDEISYTALSLYERCGYRFFAERVLGVGQLDERADGDPRSFGSALHGALQLCSLGEVVDAEHLRAIASAHRLASPDAPRLEATLAAVRRSTAWPFILRGSPEVAFAVPVEGGIVRGSMDLVVREGARAIVLDYKTGTGGGDGERYRDQAEVYGLALLTAGFDEVEVRFVHVEDDCRETVFRLGADDAGPIGDRIATAFRSIAAGDFSRRPHFDADTCPDCPVSGGLCPVTHPGGTRSGTASA